MQYPVMVLETKHCNGCDEDKELTEFYVHKSGKEKGKPFSCCKKCDRKMRVIRLKANPEKAKAGQRTWRQANLEKERKRSREYSYRHGSKPISENKASPLYLGCVVAETVLSHEFPGFVRMPFGNPNYDYDCPKGFKIDVKSSCRHHYKDGTDNWKFSIRRNKFANYFLLLAFCDRNEPLVPEHIWLVPGDVVNDKTSIIITDSPRSLTKWSQYERPLDNVLECCNKLRGIDQCDITASNDGQQSLNK